MPIPYFGPAQTDAFIPALGWLLVATVLVITPVVLGPLLARTRRGRVVTVLAVALAVAAVVPAALQAAQGFTVLGEEHALVARTMASRYGIDVTGAEASSLIEGGKVKPAGAAHTIHLEQVAPGEYQPVESGVGPLPTR